ncbi:hypothetical protein BLA24_26730 [Streptomyces cinnamoneus]|uniref:N-acetyltransferase domain-containing protein n=1 Tax=Streptomyces cinnamoneus TaxID=53446 RepID=A0A2G1XEG0_STRCJ|nr:hypothetical protein BLA24_26730 [Streptomyces cinnamoneus]PPT14662.1 methyltransferase domain-containing protein [Streptomyces cinnamoneus]
MTEPDFLTTVRTFYDAVAVDYADRYRDQLAAKPLERAMLAGFADLVRGGGGGPVADLGCGEGRVTAHLHALGLSVRGIDLSPRMIELARRDRPGLRFDVGSMLALDLPDGALAGALAWYSIIHTPQERLPDLFAELHRVLAPGGHALIAFQVGDEPLHLEGPFGHDVSLDFHRRRPDRIAELLGEAGLDVTARMVREPEDGVEKVEQAFLIARKAPEPHRFDLVQIADGDDVTPELRRQLTDCWTEVTNAGGAAGFPFPPVGHGEVAPAVEKLAGRLDARNSRLVLARVGDALAGWVFLSRDPDRLVAHWGTLHHLQTHPDFRGRGIGSALVRRARDVARDELGLEQLRLAARGGEGLEAFYERLGWRETGRWPSALRFTPDDTRDEVLMTLAPL